MDFTQSLKFRVVFLGDQNVGKTAIITQFMYGSTGPLDNHPTIGIDFLSKSVEVPNYPPIHLQLWDTAGQERYRSLIPSYTRLSNAAIVVYDISDRKSFENVSGWIDELLESSQDPIIYIVSNKVDLDSATSGRKRVVGTQEGRDLAKKHQAIFFETSAKKSTGVADLFEDLARRLHEKNNTSQVPVINPQVVNISSSKEDSAASSSGCC